MELKLAFSTILVIVLILFPGMLFRRFYYQKNFTKQFRSGLFNDRLISNTFWGIVIQLFTLLFFYYTTSDSYRFVQDEVKSLLSSNYTLQPSSDLPNGTNISKKTQISNEVGNVKANTLFGILLYISVSLVVAMSLGWAFHKFVRLLKLDLRIEVLRFSNRWHYFFKGEDFIRKKEKQENKKFKYVNTQVRVLADLEDSGAKLYTGTLEDYNTDSHGNLDTVYLIDVESTDIDLIYEPEDHLIISYNKVSSLSISYILEERQSSRFWSSFISILLNLIFLCIVTLPWYLFDVGFFRMVLGIFLTLLSFFNIILLVSPSIRNIDKENNDEENKNTEVNVVFIAIAILFILLAALDFGVLPI